MVTSADPHNVNNVLYVRRINYEIHFSWQVQYLVKLDFFLNIKCVCKMRRVRSLKRRVRNDDFMLGLSSDHIRMVVESSLFRRKQFKDFPLKS